MKNLVKMRTWALAVLSVGLAGCGGPRPSAPSADDAPELLLEGVRFKTFRGSELKAIGRARASTFRRSTGDVTGNRVQLSFPNAQDGGLEAQGGSAKGNIHTQLADVGGGVRVTDSEGRVATTARCHVDARAQLATGTDPVAVTGGTFRQDAQSGFELSFGPASAVTFLGPVTTPVEVE